MRAPCSICLLAAAVNAVAVAAHERIALGGLEVFLRQFGHQLAERHPRFPFQLPARLGRIAEQGIDFSGTIVARVNGDDDAALGVVALLARPLAAPTDL